MSLMRALVLRPLGWVWWLLAGFGGGLTAYAAAAGAVPEVVRYAADPGFAPVDFVNDGRHQGLAEAYLSRAAKAAGVRLQRVPAATWSEALGLFRRGQVDLLSSAFVSAERAELGLFSEPWLRLSAAILGWEGQAPLNTLEALAQRPVGVVNDSVWHERLRSGGQRLQLQPYPDIRAALLALRSGEVVAVVNDPVTAYHAARQLGDSTRLRTWGSPEFEAQLGFAIRSDLPELKAALDLGLQSIPSREETTLRERWLPQLAARAPLPEPAMAVPAALQSAIEAALAALPEDAGSERSALETALKQDRQATELMARLAAPAAAVAVATEAGQASDALQQFLLWRASLPERATAAELERLTSVERNRVLALEQALAQSMLSLDAARKRVTEVPALLEALRQDGLGAGVSSSDSADAATRGLSAGARRRLQLAQLASLQAELESLPARIQRLEVETREQRNQLAFARQRVQALETLQRERVVREAEARLIDIQVGLASVPAELHAGAQHNLQLAQQWVDLATRYAARLPEAARESTLRDQVAQSLKLTRERLSVDARSAGLGQVLVAEQRQLQPPRLPRRLLAEVQAEMGALRLEQLERMSQREQLAAQTAGTELAPGAGPGDPGWLALDQRHQQRLLLDELDALTQRQQRVLDAMAADLRTRIEDSEALQSLIADRLLWLPTLPPVSVDWLRSIPQGFAALLDPSRWSYTARLLWTSVWAWPFAWLGGLAAGVLLWRWRRRMPARFARLAMVVRQDPAAGMWPTLQVAALSLIAAAFWPGVLWTLGEVLTRLGEPNRFSDSLGLSLQMLAWQIYSLNALWWLTHRDGLTEAHFHWPEARSRALHRFAARLLWIVPPLLFLGILEHQRGTQLGSSTVGRLALIALQVLLARAVWKRLRPGAALSLFGGADRPEGGLWRHVLHALLPAALGVLALLLLAGYGPIAYVLLNALVQTLILLFAVLVLQQLALRWLLVQERKLAELRYQQAQATRAAEAARAQSSDAPPPLEREHVTLANIAGQTRRLLRAALVTVFGLGLLYVWSELLPALKALDAVRLWQFSSGDEGQMVVQYVTLRALVLALLSFMLTFIAARNLPGLLEVGLLERFPVDAATRYAITSVARYIIVITGLVIGIGLLGLRWGHLQWLAAALTVGLGFGLQEIFANFVSGLILLFERPFRVGDTITVGNLSGTVTRIRTRATTILDWDNKEIIVPNKTFITGDLTNWTLTDEVTRVTIAVGVAYESDPARVHEVLRAVAMAHPLVLRDPKPSTWMMRFGASSLDFELRVHVAHIRDRLPVTSDLNRQIHQRFAAEGIEIPFPQVEMRQRQGRWTGSGDPEALQDGA